MKNISWLLMLALGLSLAACSDDDDDDDDDDTAPTSDDDDDTAPTDDDDDDDTVEGFNAQARQELLDAELDRYFDAFDPVDEEAGRNGETFYHFDTMDGDGPICLWGEPYSASVLDRGSENLIIYLQGGGACWTGLCAANEEAVPDITTFGILDGDGSKNVVGDWNIVYAPYCDGSVFSGDNDIQIEDEDGTRTRYHRGLRNLSAAVDLARDHFPNPKKILLTGSSAGGYGTILGTAVVRLQYPNTRLYVINDAGPGLQNLEQPAAMNTRREEWAYEQFIPASCANCADGQLSTMVAWGLRNDSSLKVGLFSSYEDAVIGFSFLQLPGPEFKAILVEETGKINQEFPDRFKRFFIDGSQHTGMVLSYYTSDVRGDVPADWAREMITDSPDWADTLQ